MKDHFPQGRKSSRIKRLLNEAIVILHSAGVPVNGLTERRLERMALCFLAVSGVTKSWRQAQSLSDKRYLKTREIIEFINQHFDENISSGSYDDIRRKDLKLPVLAGLIVNSGLNPTAATNDPTRGYSLHPDFGALVRTFGTKDWETGLRSFLATRETLAETLARKRAITKVPVILPEAKSVKSLTSRTWVRQQESVVICFDLPKGATTITV